MSSGDQEALDLADRLTAAEFGPSVGTANAAASTIRRLVAEREADRRELAYLRARIDRAIKAAEEHFGEDAIRYKLSLFKNGRASNYFPQEFDGKWFAFQRADDDAHIGLCDRINQLEAEREADRAAMREALEALENGRRVRNCEGGTKYQPPLEDAAISSLKARTQ